MARSRVLSCISIALATFVLLLLSGGQTLAQGNDINTLLDRADKLRSAGKYAEAVPLAQKSLELAHAKFGAEHPSVAE